MERRRSLKRLSDAWVSFHSTDVVHLAWEVTFWKKFTFNRAQDVVRKPLVYSADCGACWSQGSHSNSAPEISCAIVLGVGLGGMSYWVYVTLSCHNWKRNDFRYSGAYFIYFVYRTNVYWSVIHGIKRKNTFIGGMELVSHRCNREFTSASSYGLVRYKYAMATQWYQFHTTDAWWFSLTTTCFIKSDIAFACTPQRIKHGYILLTTRVTDEKQAITQDITY